MKAKSAVIVVILVLITIAIMIIFSGKKESLPRPEIDAFAQCLSAKGTVMYGAFWCPHCANTKAQFGSSFRYITYIECDPRGDNEQSALCIEKEIKGYPTWEFADGSRLSGEQSFAALGEKAACPAPSAGE